MQTPFLKKKKKNVSVKINNKIQTINLTLMFKKCDYSSKNKKTICDKVTILMMTFSMILNATISYGLTRSV